MLSHQQGTKQMTFSSKLLLLLGSLVAATAGVVLICTALYFFGVAQGREEVNASHRVTFRCGYDTLVTIDNVRDDDLERMAGSYCTMIPNK